MKKANYGIYKALSNIPPIFSKTTLRIVERDLKTFFKSPNRRFKYSLPPNFTYFPIEISNDFELSNEDQKQLENILSLNATQAIMQLSKYPTLCRATCLTSNVISFIEFYNKDIYNEFVGLSLFGQSVDLLNFLLLKVNPPRPPLWPKPRFSKAIPWLLGPSDMPFFSPMKDKKFLSIPSPISALNEKNKKKSNSEKPIFLSHSSSFTANHNQIFFGLNNGTIWVEPYPPKSEYGQSYSINLSHILNNRLYSLCWALDELWIFTETTCYCLDISNSSFSSIKSNANGMFPVFTDGNSFYSLSTMSRIITVFTINRGQVKVLRKVRLEKPIDKSAPFITNGLFLTFSDIQEDSRVFIQFSAVNGSFIREYRSDFQTIEFAFCISPYRQRHFVLSNSKFEVFYDNFQIPRWSIGLPFPEDHISDLTSVFYSVYYALYHDKPIFRDSRYDSILTMVDYYVREKNQYGVILAAMLLCHSNNRMPINEFNQYFYNSKNESRLFLCFVFLLCLSDGRVPSDKSECIPLPNIINTFIEDEYPPIFIWLFPKFFNFKKIQFSNNAITRLIMYVTGQSMYFPDESFYILSSFLKYAFSNMLNEPDKFISSLNAIAISIEQKVVSYNDKKGITDKYIKSTVDYKVWTELLLLIYQNRLNWIYFSPLIVKFFSFGLLNNSQYCGELNRMLNCTLFIFLSLFSSISFVIYPRFFQSLDEFFKEFPHTMNGVYISIDQKIFKLLSQCNDIPSKEEFSKYFFSLRNYFIFESPASTANILPSQSFDKLLSTLQDKQYSIKGVFKYIFENDPRELIQLQNESIIRWFVPLLESNSLNDCQQCIFSIFLSTFKKIKPLLINVVKSQSAYHFMKSFSYPFLFPPEIFLNIPDINCSVQEIINYPLHLLKLSYKNIIICHKKITDSTMIVLPFINRLLKDNEHDPNLLFDPSMEPALYHDLILWIIGYKWGEIIDFRNYLNSFIVLLRNGSKREIRATMKWVYVAEFFNDFVIDGLFFEILEIIGDYLFYEKNPFHFINDPFDVAETVFNIIHYCRKLFNIKTNIFRNYLLKYIDINNKKSIITIFAILNNSIDLLRKNSMISVLDNNFLLIKGKIRDYKPLNDSLNICNCVKIENLEKNNFENVVLNDSVQMWCTPKKVNLSLLFSDHPNNISDICMKFQEIFSEVDFDYNYQNTFKLASLNTFLELDEFKNSLSDEFKQEFLYIKKGEWPNYFMMDRSYLDFSYFLTIVHSSSFSNKTENNTFFFSSGEEEVNSNSDDLVCYEDYGIEFEEEQKGKEDNLISGIQNVIAFDKPLRLKSPPIHPRNHSKITFGFELPSFSIEIFGLTDINNCLLKYGPVSTNSDFNESLNSLTIETIPSLSTIKISINGIKEINILIPPLKMLFVVLNLEPGTIGTIEYEIDPKIIPYEEIDNEIFNYGSISNYCNQCDNCCYDKMMIVNNDLIDISPSRNNPGFYEFTSLELSSMNLNKTLRQLNALKVMNELPSSVILDLLFYSNPILSDKSINFDKMISIPLWLTSSNELRKIALSHLTKERLKEIENEIINKKKNCPYVNIHHNQTFVFSKGEDEIKDEEKNLRRILFSNSLLMNDSRYIALGIHFMKVHLLSGVIIFPYLGIKSSMLEFSINCRHLIACYRHFRICSFDYIRFFESLQISDESVSQSCSALTSAQDSSQNLLSPKNADSDSDNSDNNDYIDLLGFNFMKSKRIKSISILGEIKALSELIFPIIPKEGEKPSFLDESLLIPESSVHDYPNVFFFNKYFELVSPRYHPQVFTCGSSPMYFTTTSDKVGFDINNRYFKSNQYAIIYNKSDKSAPEEAFPKLAVQKSFKAKTSDKDSMFIFDTIPNFKKIEEEFRNWKPHHSFQLLLSLSSSLELKMLYKKLPLSTKFSFEITYFMFQLLKKHTMKLNEKINSFESQINVIPDKLPPKSITSYSSDFSQSLEISQKKPKTNYLKPNPNLARNSAPYMNQNQNLIPNAAPSMNHNQAFNTQNSSPYMNQNLNRAQLANPYTNSGQNANQNPNYVMNSAPYLAQHPASVQQTASFMNQNQSNAPRQKANSNPNLDSTPYMNHNPNVNPYKNQKPPQIPNSNQTAPSVFNPYPQPYANPNFNPSHNPNVYAFPSNIPLSAAQDPSFSSNSQLRPLVQTISSPPLQVQKLNPFSSSVQILPISPPLNVKPNTNPGFHQTLDEKKSPYLNVHPYSCSNLSSQKGEQPILKPPPANEGQKSAANLQQNQITSENSAELSIEDLQAASETNQNFANKKSSKTGENEKLVPSIDIHKKNVTNDNNYSTMKEDFYYPLNMKKRGENAKFVRKINGSFKFAHGLGEFSVNSRERVDFLIGLRMPSTIFEKFEPHMVHIFTSFKENCAKIAEIKKDISIFFRTQNMSLQSLSYLQKFVQTSPDFVVLLFIEFCTGESAISKFPIYVISVNNEAIIRTSQEDHLLVVGLFPSYDAFTRKILFLIQQSQDELVV